MHEHLDLKRKKTYAALLRAFEALMKEKSFDELTVHELCQRAEIGRNTFYAHFEDKYAFFQYYITLRKEQIEAASSAPGDGFLAFRLRVVKELFVYLRDNRFIWEKNISSPSAWKLRDMMKDNVKAPLIEELTKLEQQSGRRLAVSKNLLASFYASGIIEVFTESLYNERIPEQQVLEDLERICALLFKDALFE